MHYPPRDAGDVPVNDETWISVKRPSGQLMNGLSRRSLIKWGLGSGAVLTMPSLLAGCGDGGSSGGSGSSNFIYMSSSTADTDVAWFKKVSAAMEKAGIKVRGQQLDADQDFYPQVESMISTGKYVDVLPDIDIATFQGLAAEGVLADVEDILGDLGSDFFDPSALEWTMVDGKHFGLPVRRNGFLMFYRTDLAQQAGVDVPTDFDTVASFMEATTTDDVFGNGIPYGVNTATSGAFFSYLLANGGNICDPDLNVVFDSTECHETLDFFAQINKYAPPGALNYGYAEVLQNFTQGKTATVYYAGRVLQSVHDGNPAIADDFSAFRIPKSDGSGPSPSYGSGAISAILAKAPDPAAAKKWMEDYQFHAPYYIDALLGAPGNDYPVVNLSADEKARYDADPILQKYADIVKITTECAGASVSPSQESPDHKQNVHGGDIIAGPIIPTAIQNVVTGKKSAADAAKDAAAQMKEIMDS